MAKKSLCPNDVRRIIKADGKVPTVYSTPSFLVTIFLGVPIWLLVLLPLAILTQIANFIFPKKQSKTNLMMEVCSEENEEFPSLSDTKPMDSRKYDVVLLGATGFTGRLATNYLASTYGVGGEVKWAIAGRSQKNLDKLKRDVSKELGYNEAGVDTIIVDTSVRSALHELVKDTRVVITTAGPFQKYGSPVVEFCAKYGTHYVDITGEIDWVKEMITKWDATAQSTGAKIVSLCGHDCIPWDLTVQKLSQILRDECNDQLVEARCVDEIKSAVSGGTVATVLFILEERSKGKHQYEFNPLVKKPDGSRSECKTIFENAVGVGKCKEDTFSSMWMSPFAMAAVNADTIKRSNALRDSGSISLTYQEGMINRDFKTSFINWIGLIIGFTAVSNPISRSFLEKFVFPKPGEGPSKKVMEEGFLCVNGFGVGVNGNKVETALYFPSDPGYRDTARMAVESALCLAKESHKLPVQAGGCFTPAICMGDVLLDRLCATGSSFGSRVVLSKDRI